MPSDVCFLQKDSIHLEGELEISHTQLYPGLDTQKAPLSHAVKYNLGEKVQYLAL